MIPVHQTCRHPIAATAQAAHHLKLVKDGAIEFLSQFRHSLLYHTAVGIKAMTSATCTQPTVIVGNEQKGCIGIYSQNVINQLTVIGFKGLSTEPTGRHIGIIDAYAKDNQIRRA